MLELTMDVNGEEDREGQKQTKATGQCCSHKRPVSLLEATELIVSRGLEQNAEQAVRFLVKTDQEVQPIVVHARLQDTVETVLERVNCEVPRHARFSDQHLFYLGKQLQGKCSLEQCGVTNGVTLQLVARFKSCTLRQQEGGNLVESGIVTPVSSLLSKRRNGEHLDIDGCHALRTQIKKSTAKFILAQQKSSSVVRHLEIFRNSGGSRALTSLLLSDVAYDRECGVDCIRLFTNPEAALHSFQMLDLQDWFVPILMDFCRLLREQVLSSALHETQSEVGAAYHACRCALARLLEKNPERGEVFGNLGLEREAMIQTLFGIIEEAVMRLQKGLADTVVAFVSGVEVDNSCPLTIPDAECFAKMIGPCYACIANRIAPSGVNMAESCKNLLIGLLESLEACLVGVFDFIMATHLSTVRDASYHDALQKVPGSIRRVVPIILRGMNAAQEVLESSCSSREGQCMPTSADLISFEERFSEFLKRRRKVINAYLYRSKLGPGDDLSWLLKKREFLEFETKERWVHQLLPRAGEDYRDRQEIIVARGSNVLGEAFEQIVHADSRILRNGIVVQFANEEAAGQGVVREFFALLGQEVFDPNRALFQPCPHDRQRFSPNPASRFNPGHLAYYRFCGRLVALALVHEIQIDARFSRAFFKQLAQREVHLEDAAEVDPILYASCRKILDVPPEEVEHLALTFSTASEELGSHITVELLPGGEHHPVTFANRNEFIRLLVQWHLVRSVESQVAAFVAGFEELLTDNITLKQILEPLEPEDFERILYGEDRQVELADWQAHAEYHDYSAQDLQIQWFWQAVAEMAPQQRRKLLFFATAIWNLPSNGFAGLSSRFHIFRVNVDLSRLPTAHTCFHQLLLPPYPSLEMMKGKLSAVTEDHVVWSFGFD